MASTKHQYNHTATCFANGTFSSTKTFAIELLNGSSFDATQTSKSDVDNSGAYEVFNDDWAQGGMVLNSYINIANTHDTVFGSSNISVLATTTDIGPATAALIYNIETSFPVMYYDFGREMISSRGTSFKVNFSANGILQWISTTTT